MGTAKQTHQTDPIKGMPTHECKAIYSHGWPYFSLGDLLTTTLIVKWPGASFGGQAPRWYPRFVDRSQKIKKAGPFTVDTGTDGSGDYTGFDIENVRDLLYQCPL